MRSRFSETQAALAWAFALGAFAGTVGAQEAPAAAAAIYEKVVLDANVLFDSNKSDLRAGGRNTLDAFIDRIRGLDTEASECKDASNAKNVACMQPDRHVFIEISGARLAQ